MVKVSRAGKLVLKELSDSERRLIMLFLSNKSDDLEHARLKATRAMDLAEDKEGWAKQVSYYSHAIKGFAWAMSQLDAVRRPNAKNPTERAKRTVSPVVLRE